MKINLSGMNRKDLEKLRGDVDKALKDAMMRDRQEARKAAETAAAKFGFSLDEVSGKSGPASAKGKTARKAGKAKFANPADASQTWTGKGRQPQWFKDAVAKGVSPDKMAI